MKEQTREEPSILAAAERQMQAWALTQRLSGQTVRVDQPGCSAPRRVEFVTISREAGACGGKIAELVGRKLGWEVLDKNLLDQVAACAHVPRPALEVVDETDVPWTNGLLGPWLDPHAVPHCKYVVHLTRVVLSAARRGNVVFVGRGAQFLLPRDRLLAVRIVAPENYRIAQIMRRHGLSAAKARRLMLELDRGRRQFVSRFFHRDIADPHLYDLVMNVERFGLEGAAEVIVVIVEACRRA